MRNSIVLSFLLLVILSAHAQTPKYDFVVAKDGSGNFKTVQEAIDAVPDLRRKETVIYIRNGVYKEKLLLATSKSFVHFIGESRDSVILTFDNYASKKNIFGEEMGTSGSASFYIYANNFTAENITFANSAGPVGQAVAVWAGGDKTRFINCRFLGFQDTLYTYGQGGASRQYYKDCYIEGTTDFIFGSSTAVFDHCEIFSKKGGSYITAASTPDSARFGYVFLHCRLTGSAPPTSYFLGRPWRPYAKTVFIESELGSHIRPEGWHNWSKPDAEKTSFYGEYRNTGAGASTAQRVPWSHQLTDAERANYVLATIFRDWDPLKN